MLDYRPGSGGGSEELETIQAGMLELVIPVLPHRLNDDWRKVIEQMDFLDVPGMRAGPRGRRAGQTRPSADTLEEQMEIVKRGKVSYLFERYTDELQIQTLLLLLARRQPRSQGADEVPRREVGPGPLRREGLAAQGPRRDAGPVHRHDRHRRGVPQPRGSTPTKALYDSRLGTLLDTLGNVMNDFGGKGKTLHQRLSRSATPAPGTPTRRSAQREDPEKWTRARKAFLESEMVQQLRRSRPSRAGTRPCATTTAGCR